MTDPNIDRLREFIGAWHRDTVDVMEAEAALDALASELDTERRERDEEQRESSERYQMIKVLIDDLWNERRLRESTETRVAELEAALRAYHDLMPGLAECADECGAMLLYSDAHRANQQAAAALAAELDAARRERDKDHAAWEATTRSYESEIRSLKARAEAAEAALAEAQRELSWEREVVVVDLWERLDAARNALQEITHIGAGNPNMSLIHSIARAALAESGDTDGGAA